MTEWVAMVTFLPYQPWTRWIHQWLHVLQQLNTWPQFLPKTTKEFGDMLCKSHTKDTSHRQLKLSSACKLYTYLLKIKKHSFHSKVWRAMKVFSIAKTYRVSQRKLVYFILLWQVQIYKLALVWRWFGNFEYRNF